MSTTDIFVSVGRTFTRAQEEFVQAVESRLRSEGFNPRTVGRNTFSADDPLKHVVELLDKCSGTVVIALERLYFPTGTERRGGGKDDEVSLIDTCLATPWNQIEAALSYGRGLPLLVIVAKEIRGDGLLDRTFGWYVQRVAIGPDALSSNEFNGVFASWKTKVAEFPKGKQARQLPSDPAELPVGKLLAALKPAQVWSLLGAIIALLAAAFALGAKFPALLH